jgi:hypothetical protein
MANADGLVPEAGNERERGILPPAAGATISVPTREVKTLIGVKFLP